MEANAPLTTGPAAAHARPLRICRVIARLNVGGPAVHIAQLTSGLDSQRFTQLVVAGREGPHEASMVPLLRARGIEPVLVPELGREVAPTDDAKALLALYRVFRRWQPDIVETHTAKAGTLGRLAALAARVPVRVHVFHGHVFGGYFSPRATRVYLEIERALARATTRIVTLGESQRSHILGFGIGRPQQVVSIPLGFDLAPFLAARSDAALRASLAGAGTTASGHAGHDGPVLIGCVGRLAPIKRHDVLLRALRRVVSEAPQAHLVLVGDGETRATTEALSRSLGIAQHVTFAGWRNHADLPALMASLDVLALTSDNEGMPTSLIEAMAAGTPVVATAVGGVPDLVEDGVSGLLAPAGDEAAVARALLRLVRERALRTRLGAAGRSAVYPRYDLSSLLARMNTFYTSLVPLSAPALT